MLWFDGALILGSAFLGNAKSIRAKILWVCHLHAYLDFLTAIKKKAR